MSRPDQWCQKDIYSPIYQTEWWITPTQLNRQLWWGSSQPDLGQQFIDRVLSQPYHKDSDSDNDNKLKTWLNELSETRRTDLENLWGVEVEKVLEDLLQAAPGGPLDNRPGLASLFPDQLDSQKIEVKYTLVGQRLYPDDSMAIIRQKILKLVVLEGKLDHIYLWSRVFLESSQKLNYQTMNHYFFSHKTEQIMAMPAHPFGLGQAKEWKILMQTDLGQDFYDLNGVTLGKFLPPHMGRQTGQVVCFLGQELLNQSDKEGRSFLNWLEAQEDYTAEGFNQYYWPKELESPVMLKPQLDRIVDVVDFINESGTLDRNRLADCRIIQVSIHINFEASNPEFVDFKSLFQLFPLNEKFVFAKYQEGRGIKNQYKLHQDSLDQQVLSKDQIEQWVDPKQSEKKKKEDESVSTSVERDRSRISTLVYKKYLGPVPGKKTQESRFATVTFYRDGKIEYKCTWTPQEKADLELLRSEMKDLKQMVDYFNRPQIRYYKQGYKRYRIAPPDPDFLQTGSSQTRIAAMNVYIPIKLPPDELGFNLDILANLSKCFDPYLYHLRYCTVGKEVVKGSTVSKIDCDRAYNETTNPLSLDFRYKRVDYYPPSDIEQIDEEYAQLAKKTSKQATKTVWKPILADKHGVSPEEFERRYRPKTYIRLMRRDTQEPILLNPELVMEKQGLKLPGLDLTFRAEKAAIVTETFESGDDEKEKTVQSPYSYRLQVQGVKQLQQINQIYHFMSRFLDIYFRLTQSDPPLDWEEILKQCPTDFSTLLDAIRAPSSTEDEVTTSATAAPVKKKLTKAQRMAARRKKGQPDQAFVPPPTKVVAEETQETPPPTKTAVKTTPQVVPTTSGQSTTFLDILRKLDPWIFETVTNEKKERYSRACQGPQKQPLGITKTIRNKNLERIDQKIMELTTGETQKDKDKDKDKEKKKEQPDKEEKEEPEKAPATPLSGLPPPRPRATAVLDQSTQNKINQLKELRKWFDPPDRKKEPYGIVFKSEKGRDYYYYLCPPTWCFNCQFAFAEWELDTAKDAGTCPLCSGENLFVRTGKDKNRDKVGLFKPFHCAPCCYKTFSHTLRSFKQCAYQDPGAEQMDSADPSPPSTQSIEAAKKNLSPYILRSSAGHTQLKDRYKWLDDALHKLFNPGISHAHKEITGQGNIFLLKGVSESIPENIFLTMMGWLHGSHPGQDTLTGQEVRDYLLSKHLPPLEEIDGGQPPAFFTTLQKGLIATIFDPSGQPSGDTEPQASQLDQSYQNFRAFLANEYIDEDFLWDLVSRPGVIIPGGFNLVILEKSSSDWVKIGDYDIKCPLGYSLGELYQPTRPTLILIRLPHTPYPYYYPITRPRRDAINQTILDQHLIDPQKEEDAKLLNTRLNLLEQIEENCSLDPPEDALTGEKISKALKENDYQDLIQGIQLNHYYQTKALVLDVTQLIDKDTDTEDTDDENKKEKSSTGEPILFKIPIWPEGWTLPTDEQDAGPLQNVIEEPVANLPFQETMAILDWLAKSELPTGEDDRIYLTNPSGQVVGYQLPHRLDIYFKDPVDPDDLPGPLGETETVSVIDPDSVDQSLSLRQIDPKTPSPRKLLTNKIVFEEEAYQRLRFDLSKYLNDDENEEQLIAIMDIIQQIKPGGSKKTKKKRKKLPAARRELHKQLKPIVDEIAMLVEISDEEYMSYQRPQIRTRCYQSATQTDKAMDEDQDSDEKDLHCQQSQVALPTKLTDGSANSLKRYVVLLSEELLLNEFKRLEILEDYVDIYQPEHPIRRRTEAFFSDEDVKQHPESIYLRTDQPTDYPMMRAHSYQIKPPQIEQKVTFNPGKLPTYWHKTLGTKYKMDRLSRVKLEKNPERLYLQLAMILNQVRQWETPIGAEHIQETLVREINKLDKDQRILLPGQQISSVGDYYAQLLRQVSAPHRQVADWKQLRTMIQNGRHPLNQFDLALLSRSYDLRFLLLGDQIVKCFRTTQVVGEEGVQKPWVILYTKSDDDGFEAVTPEEQSGQFLTHFQLVAKSQEGQLNFSMNQPPSQFNETNWPLCQKTDMKETPDRPIAIFLNFKLQLPEVWQEFLGPAASSYYLSLVSGHPNSFNQQLAPVVAEFKKLSPKSYSTEQTQRDLANHLGSLQEISKDKDKDKEFISAQKAYLDYLKMVNPRRYDAVKDWGSLKQMILDGQHPITKTDLQFFSRIYGVNIIIMSVAAAKLSPGTETESPQPMPAEVKLECLGTTQVDNTTDPSASQFLLVYRQPNLVDNPFRLVGHRQSDGQIKYVYNTSDGHFQALYQKWMAECAKTDGKEELDSPESPLMPLLKKKGPIRPKPLLPASLTPLKPRPIATPKITPSTPEETEKKEPRVKVQTLPPSGALRLPKPSQVQTPAQEDKSTPTQEDKSTPVPTPPTPAPPTLTLPKPLPKPTTLPKPATLPKPTALTLPRPKPPSSEEEE